MLEVKYASGGIQLDSATCSQFAAQFQLTHTLLRDDTQVQQKLKMWIYDVMVLDRYLKITFRGADLYSSTTKSQLLAAVSDLIP